MALNPGKLPLDLLEELLELNGAPDPRVHVGPAVGEDAAVVDFGDKYLILKTDPVTFAEEEIGWYAVHINANDVATTGAEPRWFQTTILLPEGSTEALAYSVFQQVNDACNELDIAITGGHIEVTSAVRRIILVGDLQGLVSKDNLVLTSGAKEHDVVIMTKSAGIEGTAILAREKAKELEEHLGLSFVTQAAGYLKSPGISVVREALIAARLGATSLHDPTEGGVAMGLFEVSKACGRVLEVAPGAIPVGEETKALCEFYGLNPLGLIGSGSLLVAIPEGRSQELLDEYRRVGVDARVIGRVGGPGEGLTMVGEGGAYDLKPSERDEITRVLAK